MNRLDPRDVQEALAGLPIKEAGAALVARVSGMPSEEVEAMLLGAAPVPEYASARRLVSWTASLLDLPRSEAAKILGVSQSRLRRDGLPTIDMLDRVMTLCEVWAPLARLIGCDAAAVWLVEPHPGLDGAAPASCFGTGYGQRRVRDSLAAAFGGAIR